MCFSSNLLRIDIKRILDGSYIAGSDLLPGLGIGVTRASFHSFSNLPDLIDMLKSFVTAGVMLPTVQFWSIIA